MTDHPHDLPPGCSWLVVAAAGALWAAALWFAFAGMMAGCTSAPLVEQGAVPVHLDLSPATTLTAEEGAVTVPITVEVPIDRATEILVPSLERISAAAIKAGRIEADQAQETLRRIGYAITGAIVIALVLAWWIGRRSTSDDVARARNP